MKLCHTQSPSKSFWRHAQWGLFILLLNWTMPGTSVAQTYPDKPIKFVVSFTAGGTTDILAREVANQLTQRWKVPVVVENKAGAAGNLGTEVVGRAAPDGYTLLVNSFGPIAINPTLFKSLNVNPQTELQPVALIAEVPTVLVVPTTMGINTMAEFMAFAKANAGNINYGSTGIGTAAHMTGYLYSLRTNINATHIPYKGAEATRDLVAGRLQYMFATVPSVMQLIKAGQLKPLAISTKIRSRGLPDVATLRELGIDMATGSWFGMFAPKQTPMAIVQKLNQEVVSILDDPQIKARLVAQGAEPIPMSVQEFTQFTRNEFETWAPIVKSSGAKPE
ncbi:tripartite tricarboxylate transporter substrate binding protein [Limnohabitans sp. Rim8]|uniref:Bug family tripartite tricarboxylate transporter substrate binding protein n=1 Tax=Limnohabitans sp. Rim8 TaxID=1100718 RepID=UPI0026050902|nr:tripartite tricarboxylate transporter substrate binding protein [Limnohabitans sp. Rim8]